MPPSAETVWLRMGYTFEMMATSSLGSSSTAAIAARMPAAPAATMSRSITILHFPHQSLRASRLSDWSLSPHLGQVMLEPLVSCLDRRTTGRPTHLALYSNCRWASLKLHPFILPRYFLV